MSENLTVEFAGICCVQYDSVSKAANVLLVDVEDALGGTKDGATHYPSLVASIPQLGNNSGMRSADVAVGVPGGTNEYAVWCLRGKAGKTVSFNRTDGLELGENVNNMVDLASVVQSSSVVMKQKPPVSAKVLLRTGTLHGGERDSIGKIGFGAAKADELKQYAQRCRVEIPIGSGLKLTITDDHDGTTNELLFSKSATILIGNMCTDMRPGNNHFKAYFKLFDGVSAPELRDDQSQGQGADLVTPWCIILFMAVAGMFAASTAR
jgi:hypothetical protein